MDGVNFYRKIPDVSDVVELKGQDFDQDLEVDEKSGLLNKGRDSF